MNVEDLLKKADQALTLLALGRELADVVFSAIEAGSAVMSMQDREQLLARLRSETAASQALNDRIQRA